LPGHSKFCFGYVGNDNQTLGWTRMRAGCHSDDQRAWRVTLDQDGVEVSHKYFLFNGAKLPCELDGPRRMRGHITPHHRFAPVDWDDPQ
jgi:hypothetical protein